MHNVSIDVAFFIEATSIDFWRIKKVIKKKLKRSIFIMIMILLIGTFFSGCTTYQNFKEAFLEKDDQTNPDTIKIGVFEPLSGKEKEDGEMEKQGIELAHDLFPEVLGKQVELVYGDNKSDVDAAASVAQELVEKQVAVVLGSHDSTLSLAGGEYFEKAKIPAIAITATNPLVTSSYDYYFRTCFVQSFQGVALAKYSAENMGFKTAAIFRDVDDDFAAAISQTFSDKFTSLTGNENAVIKVVEFKQNRKDFTAQLQQVKESGAQVVLLAGNIQDAITILRQAKEIGVQAVFLGTNDWESEAFIKEGKDAVEGAVFSTFFDADANMTENADVFLKAYREKYGEESIPGSDVALGFDAYLLAINAIGTAGTSVHGDAIRDALLKTKNFPGAAGKITIDDNGDPIKSVVIKTISNGKFVHIFTVEPIWQ